MNYLDNISNSVVPTLGFHIYESQSIYFYHNNSDKLDKNSLRLLLSILLNIDDQIIYRNKQIDEILKKIIGTQKYFCHKYDYQTKTVIIIYTIDNMLCSLNLDTKFLLKISFFSIQDRINLFYNFQAETLDIGKKMFFDNDYTQKKILDLDHIFRITRYPIHHKITKEIVFLSPQQSKIMLGLSDSLSFKDIEIQYKIKPRVTEYYLQLIKAKTGYRKKLELLCAFLKTNPWIKGR